jgi:hypothetical protein
MTTTTADADFIGLTESNCCNTCGPDGCVISGQSYCSHPRKGGLHHGQMQDADALRRMQQARDQLSLDALAARRAAQKIA